MAEKWSIADMPDLSGRVAVVTGANAGIGFEVSRELVKAGATVVFACRSERRGRAAIEVVRSENPAARADLISLDLASLASVRRFAETFKARHGRLDLLIANAGVMLVSCDTTEDGFERHFGVNHLGHFALTGRLIDRLVATGGARIVAVSSAAHGIGRIDFDDLTYERGRRYSALRAYADSKLAGLLFTYELQRRLTGSSTIAVAAHPGGAATNLGRRMSDRRWYRAVLPVLERLSQSAAEAARPILRAATDPDAVGGEFFGPSGLLGMRGHPIVVKTARRSYDAHEAERLWEISEELTGVQFP